MQSIIKKIVWACLLVVPFVALYVASGHTLDIIDWGTSGLYFPFISGKNFLFRFLIEIAFAGWVVLALRNPAYRLNWKKSPLLIAYSVFMVILLIADLHGVDPFKSMWSNFERMEGFVGHVHLFAYFIVLSAMLQSLSDYGRMFKYFIVSNIVVLIFGYGQLLGAQGYIFAKLFPKVAAIFSGAFPIHMSENRLDATLGNSAYFAIYCLMFAFIAALLWSQKKDDKYKWFYPALIVLNLIALFYTGTRGTQIGLLVGGFITLGFIGWTEKGRTRKTVATLFVVAAVLVTSIFAFKNTSFIQSSPTLARFASISPNDLTGMSRLSIWKISYEAFKERPILGYGQDNFDYIFARKFIPEKMWMLEAWYDRSHDVFFDWLVAAGLLGLIAYLSLYVIALYLMWIRKNDMPFKEKAILTGALAGYFVHNIFVFDNLISYVLFFALLAYIAFRTGTRGEVHGGTPVREDTMNMLWLPLVGVVLVAMQYYVNYVPLHVNQLLVKGLDVNRLMQTMQFKDVVQVQKQAFQQAVAAHTLGSTEAREQFMQSAARMAQINIPSDISAQDRQVAVSAIGDLVNAARQDASDSYEANKDNVRMLSIYGMFFNGIGDGSSAEKILSRAHDLAPKKQLISFDLTRAYLLEGKNDQAYELAKQTYELAPAYTDAARVFVLAAVYDKKWNDMSATLAAQGQTTPFDADVLNALVGTGQTSLAIQLLNQLKTTNPQYAGQIDTYIKQLLAAPKK